VAARRAEESSEAHFDRVVGKGRGTSGEPALGASGEPTLGKLSYPDIECVRTREQLQDLAKRLGVRPDWHEPDEQDLEAKIFGKGFDNAMGSGYGVTKALPDDHEGEMNVVLLKDGEPCAAINLAYLFAWACGTAE